MRDGWPEILTSLIAESELDLTVDEILTGVKSLVVTLAAGSASNDALLTKSLDV